MKSTVRWSVWSSELLLLLLAPHLLLAQDVARSGSSERFAITFGAFVTDQDAAARLDADSGRGTDIDLEDDLGLDISQSVARLGGYWWLGEQRRHRTDFSFFDLSRTASSQLDDDIIFGGEFFPASSIVESTTDLTILKAEYTFAFISRKRGFLGVVGGFYIARMGLSIQEIPARAAAGEDFNAPLPVLGLRGEYEISDRISISGMVQGLLAESSTQKGAFRDIYFGADYRISDNFYLGLAYNDVAMDLDVRKSGFNGRVDWSYDGLLLYMKYDFHRSR
jgi:hypothetical protein